MTRKMNGCSLINLEILDPANVNEFAIDSRIVLREKLKPREYKQRKRKIK